MSEAQTLVRGTATAAAQARFPDPHPISIIRSSRSGSSRERSRRMVRTSFPSISVSSRGASTSSFASRSMPKKRCRPMTRPRGAPAARLPAHSRASPWQSSDFMAHAASRILSASSSALGPASMAMMAATRVFSCWRSAGSILCLPRFPFTSRSSLSCEAGMISPSLNDIHDAPPQEGSDLGCQFLGWVGFLRIEGVFRCQEEPTPRFQLTEVPDEDVVPLLVPGLLHPRGELPCAFCLLGAGYTLREGRACPHDEEGLGKLMHAQLEGFVLQLVVGQSLFRGR